METMHHLPSAVCLWKFTRGLFVLFSLCGRQHLNTESTEHTKARRVHLLSSGKAAIICKSITAVLVHL